MCGWHQFVTLCSAIMNVCSNKEGEWGGGGVGHSLHDQGLLYYFKGQSSDPEKMLSHDFRNKTIYYCILLIPQNKTSLNPPHFPFHNRITF